MQTGLEDPNLGSVMKHNKTDGICSSLAVPRMPIRLIRTELNVWGLRFSSRLPDNPPLYSRFCVFPQILLYNSMYE